MVPNSCRHTRELAGSIVGVSEGFMLIGGLLLQQVEKSRATSQPHISTAIMVQRSELVRVEKRCDAGLSTLCSE